jgi:hypothetical protein
VTGHTGSAVPPQRNGVADGEEPAAEAAPPLPRRVPGQASQLWAGRRPGATKGTTAGTAEGPEEGAPASLRPGARERIASQRAVAGKPTPAELGIDLAALEWERSGNGEGRIEVAFPCGPASGEATWSRGKWVLMRVTGDPASRILVFDRNEWECFLDGVRNGEFDDAV